MLIHRSSHHVWHDFSYQRTKCSNVARQLGLSKVKTGLTCNLLVQDIWQTHLTRGLEGFPPSQVALYVTCYIHVKDVNEKTLKNPTLCPANISKGLKMIKGG